MENEEFEKVFEKIYAPIRSYVQNPCVSNYAYMKREVKQILEEIYNKGYEDGEPAKWTIHYPKNMKRG